MGRGTIALVALAAWAAAEGHAWAFAGPITPVPGTCESSGGGGGGFLGGLFGDIGHAADFVADHVHDGFARATDFVGLHIALTGHEQDVFSHAHAHALAVPSAQQRAGECGLYALHDVMAYWHARDPRQPLPEVNTHVGIGERIVGAFVNDLPIPGFGWIGAKTGLDHEGAGDASRIRRTGRPGSILGTAIAHGVATSVNSGSTAPGIAALAQSYGYGAIETEGGTLDMLKADLAVGIPPIVTIRVNHEGNPTPGTLDHTVVITSISRQDGRWYVTAVHGWSSKPYVWTLDQFMASWKDSREIVEVFPGSR